MRSRRVRLVVSLAAGAAALALLAIFGLASNGRKAGKPAPALPKQVLVAPAATLASLRTSAHGRAAIVVFWASWCEPCQSEAAGIERFSQSAAGRGRIVGVDWRDAISGARAFIARNKWSFPNLRDGEGTVGNAYEISDLPTSFVLDGKGRISAELRGPQDQTSLTRALSTAEHA